MRNRILTGDRPTGKLHLGHYVGSLASRVQLQHKYETFILVADVQAATDYYDDIKRITNNVLEVTIDNLSVGLDPNVVTFYIQSAIPETSELAIYLMNFITLNKLLRNPTVKNEIHQKKEKFKGNPPVGFITYPVHQAADILTPRATLVPVGEDQLPMIEDTNIIIRKFNELYGTTFDEVQPYLSKTKRLVGTDGNAKMSKSLGNTIYLSDNEEEVKIKVKKMYTDPNRIKKTDPGKVEGNPVFVYHDVFNPDKAEVEDLKDRYIRGNVGDVEVKDKLAKAINNFLDPIREKRRYYEKNIDLVKDILNQGTKKASEEAKETLDIVKKAMGLKYKFL